MMNMAGHMTTGLVLVTKMTGEGDTFMNRGRDVTQETKT